MPRASIPPKPDHPRVLRGMIPRRNSNSFPTFPLTCLALSKIIQSMGRRKNPHAQALGSLGGKARAKKLPAADISKIAGKGGQARANKLSATERIRIAKSAVAARERKRAQAKKGES